MSLSITLYTSTADPKEVDKSSKLTQVGSASITATPTESIDMLNPQVILNYDASYLSANYAYISDFGRYYYIDGVDVQPGQMITLSMSVDPLMSFASEIANCTACVTRSESVGQPTMVPDERLPINPNKKELLTAFSNFMNNGVTAYDRSVLVTIRQPGYDYPGE